MTDRPSWESIWWQQALVLAQRGSCSRLRTACLIVSEDNRLLSSGYNGSPPGHPTCLEVGCLLYEHHCVRTVHAELNAVLHAARFGISIDKGVVYTIARPCIRCATVLLAAGIKHINYWTEYPGPDLELVQKLCDRGKVPLVQVSHVLSEEARLQLSYLV